MLRPAQICKKCAVLVDLKVILIYFWALTFCDIHFCIWKFSRFIFMGSLLWSILVCKIPELRRWKLWNPNFALFDSGNMHIKEIRKITFTFSTVLKTKFAWLHGIQRNFLLFFLLFFFLIISKGKVLRADRKNPYIFNYWWAGVSNYVYSKTLVITKIYIFILYFTLVLLLIMRSQPASTEWTITSTAAFSHCWSYTEHSDVWLRYVSYPWY